MNYEPRQTRTRSLEDNGQDDLNEDGRDKRISIEMEPVRLKHIEGETSNNSLQGEGKNRIARRERTHPYGRKDHRQSQPWLCVRKLLRACEKDFGQLVAAKGIVRKTPLNKRRTGISLQAARLTDLPAGAKNGRLL